MKSLRDTFEQAYTHLSRLVEKVEQGQFLEESEFFGAFEQLTKLDREQKRCVLELALEGESGLSLAKIEEIQAIRRQRKELEEKVTQLREVAQTFLSVRYTGEDSNCRQDLDEFRLRMEQCADQDLIAMNDSQELDHYRQFNAYVVSPPDFSEGWKVSQYFGYPLAMALMGRQLTLADEAVPTSVWPEEITPEPVPEEPAAEEPIAEDPVPEEPAAEETAAEETAAEETVPEEPAPMPPVCDLAALGELKMTHSGKNQGSKVFERLCRDAVIRLGADCVLSGLYNFSVYTPDMETGKGPSAVSAAKNFADKLYKDGYVQRYTLDLLPDTELYCLSRTGRENIEKRNVQDLFGRQQDSCCAEEPRSAADYVRLYWGEALFGQFVDNELDVFAQHTEGNGYALVSVSLFEGDPVDIIVIPAALYTENDLKNSLRDLDDALRERVAKGTEELTVFIASLSEEDSFGWAEYLRATGAIPENIPVLCSTIGSDAYIDAEGNLYSLNERIESLRARRAEALQAQEPAEAQPEEPAPAAEPSAEIPEEEEPAAAPPEPEPAPAVTAHLTLLPETEYTEAADLDFDISVQTARQIAELLLGAPSQIRESHLLQLTARLISEKQLASAAALAEIIAKAPAATPLSKNLYRAFRQSAQFPGETYLYTSNLMDEQQNLLPGEDTGLKGLQQTMVLAMQLWAMVFPTDAFDHALYNNATMVLNGEVERYFSGETSQIRQLMDLLGTQLKTLSFKNDGLGFSAAILSKLADDGERKEQINRTCGRAGELRRVPTSTVGINGLETCLKRMVGPSTPIGEAVEWVSKDDRTKCGEIRRRLETELQATPSGISDETLETYIDTCWNELRRTDSEVKVKRLKNDSPARKVCKKALEDRSAVLLEWLAAVEAEEDSQFLQHREAYARLLNQTKTGLEELRRMLEDSIGAGGYADAGRVILSETVCRILDRLNGTGSLSESTLYRPLALMLELPLSENGEPEIISELYGVKGLEPWLPLLEALVRVPESAEAILDQIDSYSSPWYRNYGTEALLRRYEGGEAPQRPAADISVAEKAARDAVQQFQSETRLNRAYGKIREHLMETAFSILDLVQTAYFRTHNYGGFACFLDRLKRVVNRAIRAQALSYRKRVDELKADSHYVGAPIFDVIESALADENFVRAESYINRLKNGEREITPNERTSDTETDFFAVFQSCEEAYFNECQKHRGGAPGNWGEVSLKTMGSRYQHWTSPNESKNGYAWLKNWVLKADSEATKDRVRHLIDGLGFQVERIDRNRTFRSSAEVFEVYAKKTSTALKDYSHPIYKFGTDLSSPMYVVCLYGCKGSSTVIDVMTNELQLNGSTIVLMDGSLSAVDRRRVAAKFKANTSGQSPFLLIDRVLLLYLASLDQGDRLKAMLCCTLPYTFEVLYGNGTGVVPEEMFIGRVGEMNNLRDRNGPMLVYGGRQLGKTALLNRASRTLHLPEKMEYSFCVEVKDRGSDVLLEKLNQQLCRFGLIDGPSPSISHLCQALSAAYADGRFSALQIFVDEVDVLFEEFKASNFDAVRPFIVVRDDTKARVKFVFAGTHNVADTSAAEKNNNNLIHMGAPLCIEPLSTDDAVKLIRRPLSYLGFKIGQQQIELILSSTNSYPGLIHMFCNALIQSVCRDYDLYYNGTEAPPYQISDEQMIAVFKEKDIRKEIGKRVMATIELNQRYHVVSCMLAHMVYEDQEQERSRLYGYSAQEILDYNNREFKLRLLSEMDTKDLGTLLTEMVRMGILWKNDETGQFRFRQQDFLSYIGTDDTVIKELFKAKEMED